MSGCPRIYNLFPLLAGPIATWDDHLPRIRDMGFDWIFLNPIQYPGFSGSLYAIKDYYELHPVVRGASMEPADVLISRFVAKARAFGLSVMMDLVINHTARDSLLAAEHPEFFMREADGSLRSPRAIDPDDPSIVTVWGDLAEIDYDHQAANTALLDTWRQVIAHYLDLGIRGFRCDAAYQVPAEVWRGLIQGARGQAPEAVFAAETLGCTDEQVDALSAAGFDYRFNSAKWWDFKAPWLLRQYERHRAVAPSIAFPESHDTERLGTELAAAGLSENAVQAWYRLRYLFSAAFSAGVMMPMGFEFGFRKRLHVVETRPGDWEHMRFDLSGFIAAVNRVKAALPALCGEGPQRLLPAGQAVALLRENAGARSLLLVNPGTEPVALDLARLCADAGLRLKDLADMTPGVIPDAAPEGLMLLAPAEIRLLATRAPTVAALPRAIAGMAPGAAEALAEGRHGDPFAVLGMHADASGLWVRSLQPTAEGVVLIDAESGQRVASLERVHGGGLFALRLESARPFAYRLAVDGVEHEDPYRFPPILGDLDVHLLAEGNHLRLFEKLGAHPMTCEGVPGVAFAVWAPNASRVSVIGDFNGWDGRRHPMRLRRECGVWEIFLPHLAEGALYKFELLGPGGELLAAKADPFAFRAELPPRTASVVEGNRPAGWRDGAWMERRAEAHHRAAPISIYEVHLGSWRRKVEERGRFLTYAELADELIPYAKNMGFTHLELLPVSEFPFDGSWGYQPIGMFAPTSRFGSPEDFRTFVERCHQAGLGVLVDWVPGHFPEDAHGLGYFDGTHLYEHADTRKGRHLDWGTLIYNYGRHEVSNFLLSSALYWLEKYHIDGLRVDAVASMLYLDYSRPRDAWIPNEYGGNENLEAVRFIRRMNEEIYRQHPDTLTVAEESTAWPMVSRPTDAGGLGFGFKWNMGWMHDTLRYIAHEPIHRRYHQDDMTFGLLYAFHENFILPLSHDEVVHGKGSILGRMPGDRWQRFANLRAYYGFMFTHPGKKLLFMGAEFGQEREWNHDSSLDWHLLDDPLHAGVQSLVRDLNRIYRATPALHEKDCEGDGFAWIDCEDRDNSVLSFLRKGKHPDDFVVVVCNFTPVVRERYRIGVPAAGWYAERLNTDSVLYGGSDVGNGGGVPADPVPMHGHPYSLSLTLPPLAVVVLQPWGRH